MLLQTLLFLDQQEAYSTKEKAVDNTELSIEIMRHIQRMLNNQIENHGKIKINNKIIWDGFLHKMDNEVWRGCLETLQALSEQHPALFTPYHLAAIESGLKMRSRQPDYKKTAWRCLMTIREVMNNATNIHIDNTDESRVKTQFRDLFK